MAEHIPELLAPAGSYEAAMAALCSGADAIYLGAAAFGARASAGFSQQELRQVIDLYHFYGRRVYVTVNTLVKQRELDGVRDTLRMLSDLRADAVLVQDLGVLSLIAREFPHLCVHASTQMALHNAAGARLARSLGMRRVVLARECTLDAIRAVADTGVETEVFVHGAQCVCVSGQCRYSGLIGGRSGNRGRCAQPCRLPYAWQGETRAWLSPRDLCLRDQVKALAEAGVCSLKIEGRLKRPEYVAVVTRAYRGALDALRAGRFAPAGAAEREALSQVFSRTFFPGYAFGARDAQVMNPQRVSSAGVDVGTVRRVSRKGDVWLAQVQLSKTLHNGDGLQLRGAREQDIIYSGPETPAGSLATLRLHHPAQTGDTAVRIDDEAQLSAARASYQAAALPRVQFDAQLTAQPGHPAVLTVQDDRAQATVSGEIVQSAQNAPLDEDRARRALGKTGDTAYILRDLTVTGENAYLPAAALNALRREALAQLREARIVAHRLPPAGPYQPAPTLPARENVPPQLFAQATDPALCSALLENGADQVIYAPLDITEPAFSQALFQLPDAAWVALPVQLTDMEMSRLTAQIAAHGLRVCLGSAGQLPACPAPLMTGEGVPVWNDLASDLLLAQGAQWQTLPRELTAREIAELLEKRPAAQLILPVYGRARLMYLNHCPARTALGLSGERQGCCLCAQGRGCVGQALTDRMGERFPLLPVRMDAGCLVQLLSCQVRSLSALASPKLHWLLDFTLEEPEEALRILRAYRALREGGSAEIPCFAERFDRGVE